MKEWVQLDIFGGKTPVKDVPVFYNTTELRGDELKAEQVNASTQEAEVLRFFRAHPGTHTPWEVLEGTDIQCINSVRRAMTNLTNAGRLEKTEEKRAGGAWNKKSFTWKIA